MVVRPGLHFLNVWLKKRMPERIHLTGSPGSASRQLLAHLGMELSAKSSQPSAAGDRQDLVRRENKGRTLEASPQ